MNKLTIIGNLTKDPELRTTTTGINVCSFTVAVNKPRRDMQQEADYFRVVAWRERGELCAKFLQKGRKVCVIGPVRLNIRTGQNGKTYADMEVTADEVEFLSGIAGDPPVPEEHHQEPEQTGGFTAVETDELPF